MMRLMGPAASQADLGSRRLHQGAANAAAALLSMLRKYSRASCWHRCSCSLWLTPPSLPTVCAGIGGVHRGGEASMDISADLTELGRTPVRRALVCTWFCCLACLLEPGPGKPRLV